MSGPTIAPDPEALLAHGDFVRAVARSLLWDEHAAEDVVQQTWLAALGGRREVSRGWLGAGARNLAIKRLRGDRRRTAREAAVARSETAPSNADVLERERLRRSVVDATLALPEPYRATILFRYFEGLPPREVASRMGVPVETVRTRTRRAIELLRAQLDERHRDERGAFCAALAAWSGGGRGGGASGATAAAVLGGAIMGTKLIAAGAVLVVAGLAAYLLWPRDVASTPADTADAPAPAPAPKSPSVARTSAPQPEREEGVPAAVPAPIPTPRPIVRGRVVDAEGRPVAAFQILIVGNEVIPPDASGKRPTGNTVIVTTDDEGRFAKELPSAARCRVMPSPMGDPRFQPKRGDVREVVPPADVEFVVDRHPTATLLITAVDLDAGKPVLQPACAFARRVARVQPPSPDGRVEALVRLAAAEGDTVKLTVSAGGATAERDVAVREDERVEVRVEMRLGAATAGRVVDAEGRPLAGAVVFFGEEDVGRGDEPFKPFVESRIRNGARTDGDGRFSLHGTGRWITAWHPDASPVTVPADRATDLVLPARGFVRGVVRGADGAPLPAQKVFLDRKREATTDAEGRFGFDAVEAGTRGLSLTGDRAKSYVGVRVAPGETTEVDLRPGIGTVRIEWPGRSSFGRGDVCLVAQDRVGSLTIAKAEGAALVASDVLPGRYVLLCEGGGVATVDVQGPVATAIAGSGAITVHAKAGKRVYVAPAGVDYLVRLMAGRVASVGSDAQGVARFTGLAPGRWDVGVELDGVRTTVDVTDAPVEVTID